MNITLKQLKSIDDELVIEGNMVYLHENVEWICYSDSYFTTEEWEAERQEFEDCPHTFYLGDDENGGVITAAHFPEFVDYTMEEFEQSITAPESGVYVICYRVISSLFPVVMEFPTDNIDEDEVYDVFMNSNNDGNYEDIESYDYVYKVCYAP